MKKVVTVLAVAFTMTMQAQVDFVNDLAELLHAEVTYTDNVKEHTYMEVTIPNYVEVSHIMSGVTVVTGEFNGKVYKEWAEKADGMFTKYIYYYIGDSLRLVEITYDPKSHLINFVFKDN